MTGKPIINPPRWTEASSRLKTDFDAIELTFCKTAKDVLKHLLHQKDV